MNNDIANRVKEIQTAMVESAKSCFDDSELGHLRTVIRLTVEFRHYLEHGSVEMARGLQGGLTQTISLTWQAQARTRSINMIWSPRVEQFVPGSILSAA
jgi:hypothetical protein